MPAALKDFRTHSLVVELLTKCTFASSNTAIHCAVSGGADSVALLVLAAAHSTDVTAWHVDHGLRDGSSAEAQIVHDIALALGAKFEVLFQTLIVTVSYFVIFCNLFNLLDVVSAGLVYRENTQITIQ